MVFILATESRQSDTELEFAVNGDVGFELFTNRATDLSDCSTAVLEPPGLWFTRSSGDWQWDNGPFTGRSQI